MNIKTILLSAVALTMAVSSAVAAPGGIETSYDKLVDANGMTLYTFDKDDTGASNCAGDCAINWPPLAVAYGDKAWGDFTVVDRADGTSQWAYKDQPLYLWINDAKPGDTTGDGIGGVWHIAAE